MSECSAYQAIHIPAKMIVSDKKIITVSIEGRQRFAGLFISHNPLRGRRYRGRRWKYFSSRWDIVSSPRSNINPEPKTDEGQ